MFFSVQKVFSEVHGGVKKKKMVFKMWKLLAGTGL